MLLAIEISQMFTLYRATDIDDLFANTIGAVIGYELFGVFCPEKKEYRYRRE